MTEFERDEFLDKLRSKYKEAAEKHGNRIFNCEDLENRIDFLYRTKGIVSAAREELYFNKAHKGAWNMSQEIPRLRSG